MMTEKQLNDDNTAYFDRCSNCIHFKSYYFDDYDADCYCSVFDDLKKDYCKKFKKKVVE